MTKSSNAPAPILWASNRFQLACPEHVPPIASGEWWAGQWRVFGPDEQLGYQGARSEPPECWACRALAEVNTMTQAPPAAAVPGQRDTCSECADGETLATCDVRVMHQGDSVPVRLLVCDGHAALLDEDCSSFDLVRRLDSDGTEQ